MMGASGPGRARWAAEGLLLRPWELRGLEMGRSTALDLGRALTDQWPGSSQPGDPKNYNGGCFVSGILSISPPPNK